MIITLSSPEENPPPTSLPWGLLQVGEDNFLVGHRGRTPIPLAHVISAADAMFVFRAVHSFHPMLLSLRMIRFRLCRDYADGKSLGLGVQFTPSEHAIIKAALAIAESEVKS